MDQRGLVITDLPDELPTRPRRRIPATAGVAVLLAIALVLATVAGARARAVAGAASPGPRAALPVAGDCLRWDVDPTRQTVPVAGSVRIIGCAELHQGQVLQAWRIGAQPSSSSIEATCAGGDHDLGMGVLSTDWDGGFVDRSSTIITSGTEGVDFLACVLTLQANGPGSALLTLTAVLESDTDNESVEALRATRLCFDDDGLAVGCQQPHVVERIGTWSPSSYPDQPAPTSSCDDFARRAVGSTAPFSGGAALTTREVRTGAGGLQVSARDYCDIVAPVGRTLIGTVVGLGDAPLPLG